MKTSPSPCSGCWAACPAGAPLNSCFRQSPPLCVLCSHCNSLSCCSTQGNYLPPLYVLSLLIHQSWPVSLGKYTPHPTALSCCGGMISFSCSQMLPINLPCDQTAGMGWYAACLPSVLTKEFSLPRRLRLSHLPSLQGFGLPSVLHSGKVLRTQGKGQLCVSMSQH